jgi:hypothetical protein
MVELLVASAFVGAGVVAVARRSTTAVDALGGDRLRSGYETDGADLPCPWCRAATGENDQRCPSCGQRFG